MRRSTAEFLVQDRGYATPCWVWRKNLNDRGYGLSSSRGHGRLAHRVVYQREVGLVPDGMELDHLCRVRACVNPDHLEPVTHAENCRRGAVARLTEDAHPLARLRSTAGLSQDDLARTIGCNQSLVAQWERGQTGITPEFAARLRAVFGDNPIFERGLTLKEKQACARSLRAEGLTQEAIAAHLGVSGPTVCRWLQREPVLGRVA